MFLAKGALPLSTLKNLIKFRQKQEWNLALAPQIQKYGLLLPFNPQNN